MTVKYAKKIATHSHLGGLAELLLIWKGSVYKVVWAEYLVFLALYFIISGIYRFILDDDGKRSFEKIANFCDNAKESFRVYFVLGFLVTSIFSKRGKLYDMIPNVDPIAHYVYASIRGEDEEKLRKSIVRLSCLSLALTFRRISPKLKLNKDSPTLDVLIREKMLTKEEKLKLLETSSFDKKNEMRESETWLPIKWATNLVLQAKLKKGTNDNISSKIIDQLDILRNGCSNLLHQYKHNSVPLAYLQVVAISVYIYIFFCLLGRQWMEKSNRFPGLDLYFPFVTTFEFIFYIGWLKVAGSMINPFGGDEDDFELEKIITRNLDVTSYMVDKEEFAAENMHDVDAGNKEEVTHYFNNDTKISCESGLDPERIPLSPRP